MQRKSSCFEYILFKKNLSNKNFAFFTPLRDDSSRNFFVLVRVVCGKNSLLTGFFLTARIDVDNLSSMKKGRFGDPFFNGLGRR